VEPPVPASLFLRSTAFLIDFVGTALVTGLFVLICVQIGFGGYNGVSGMNDTAVLLGLYGIWVIPAAVVVLNLVLASTVRYTIGKWMTGLRIIRYIQPGPAADFGPDIRAPHIGLLVLRTAILVAPLLLSAMLVGNGPAYLLIALAAWVTLLVTTRGPDRRGWHDFVGGTRVVRAS